MSKSSPMLVFDLDGTLCDTADDLIATLNHVLSLENAAPVTSAAARHLVGNGARVLIRRGLAESGRQVSDEQLEELFVQFLRYYDTHIAIHSQLYPGVVASLDHFAVQGYHFAVCTNKLEGSAHRLLEAMGIAQRFRAICGQDSFSVCKPNAEALLSTIARAGGEPRRAIMIGDSRTDIDTARNAQIPVIAVDFGYSDVPVASLSPDCIISHFDQLWSAVQHIRRPVTALA